MLDLSGHVFNLYLLFLNDEKDFLICLLLPLLYWIEET